MEVNTTYIQDLSKIPNNLQKNCKKPRAYYCNDVHSKSYIFLTTKNKPQVFQSLDGYDLHKYRWYLGIFLNPLFLWDQSKFGAFTVFLTKMSMHEALSSMAFGFTLFQTYVLIARSTSKPNYINFGRKSQNLKHYQLSYQYIQVSSKIFLSTESYLVIDYCAHSLH